MNFISPPYWSLRLTLVPTKHFPIRMLRIHVCVCVQEYVCVSEGMWSLHHLPSFGHQSVHVHTILSYFWHIRDSCLWSLNSFFPLSKNICRTETTLALTENRNPWRPNISIRRIMAWKTEFMLSFVCDCWIMSYGVGYSEQNTTRQKKANKTTQP